MPSEHALPSVIAVPSQPATTEPLTHPVADPTELDATADAAAPPAEEPQVAATAAVVEVLRARLRRCYERALRRGPNVSGPTRIEVDIGADGRPTSVRPMPTGTSKDVADCIVARIEAEMFPAPPEGKATLMIPLIENGRSQQP